MFSLGELNSDSWPPAAKGVIVALVLGITILSLLIKGIFCTWLYCLQRQQRQQKRKEGSKTQSPVRMVELTLVSMTSQSTAAPQQARVLRYDSWAGDTTQASSHAITKLQLLNQSRMSSGC